MNFEYQLSKSRAPQTFNYFQSPIEPPIMPNVNAADDSDYEDNEDEPDIEPTIQSEQSEPIEPIELPKQQNHLPSLMEKCADFVEEFNILHNKPSAISERDIFINKFNVIGVSCVNASVRADQPEIPPEFAEISPVPSGEYWAYEVEHNTFAIVPNIKTYSDRYHFARAMAQVFKSRFEPGIFTKSGKLWHLHSPGELALRLVEE